MIGAKDPVTLRVQNLSTPSQASAQTGAGTAGTGLTPGTKVAILRLRQSERQGAAKAVLCQDCLFRGQSSPDGRTGTGSLVAALELTVGMWALT